MKKKNCWEFKNCGQNIRDKKGDSRPCQVPKMAIYDGVNNGENGGRVCWIIADSVCEGKVQSTFQQKLETCSACDFYKAVMEEEGGKPDISLDLLRKICGSEKK
jgi:hypothetical protein